MLTNKLTGQRNNLYRKYGSMELSYLNLYYGGCYGFKLTFKTNTQYLNYETRPTSDHKCNKWSQQTLKLPFQQANIYVKVG